MDDYYNEKIARWLGFKPAQEYEYPVKTWLLPNGNWHGEGLPQIIHSLKEFNKWVLPSIVSCSVRFESADKKWCAVVMIKDKYGFIEGWRHSDVGLVKALCCALIDAIDKMPKIKNFEK